MPIINLTKQTVRIADNNGEVYDTFEPHHDSFEVQTKGMETEVDGVPVEITRVTGIKGLPPEKEGTYYIVPHDIAATLNRRDLVSPDTGPSAIRNEDGTVHAVRRLYSVYRETVAGKA